jgi:hypothetical protein
LGECILELLSYLGRCREMRLSRSAAAGRLPVPAN